MFERRKSYRLDVFFFTNQIRAKEELAAEKEALEEAHQHTVDHLRKTEYDKFILFDTFYEVNCHLSSKNV